jgi:hypothetical protein
LRLNLSPVLRWSFMLVVVTAAAVLASGVAGAARPCGEVVLDDWLDNGRIDRIYDLSCYHAAIDRIPGELKDYTDAEEVISRALQAATGGRLARGGQDPTPEVVQPPPGATRTPTDTPDTDGDREAAPDVEPAAEASSVPVPLVILACLSLLLLAGGAVGHVARRRRGG